MKRAAFTFLEVLAVVALLAVLSGGLMWAMAGDMSRASKEDAIQKLTHADRTARLAARRLGVSFALCIDLDRQRLWREPIDDADHPRSTPVAIGSGYRIDRVMLPGNVHETGRVSIPVSTEGRSVTYAVRLAPPAASMDATDTPSEPVWLVIAGLTGEVTRGDEDDEIDNLFDTLDG